jgi:NAD(P)-dependent dehydrogenase (short-subunit alcohol dehydrogenase family)
LGKATALAFGQAGARVIVTARRVAEGSAVVQEILGQGGTARFVETDITQQSQT